MYVHVLSRENQPLMPTHPAKARRLLKAGKAELAKGKTGAFTIRLLCDSPAHTQPIEVGIDTGSKFVGVSAVANGQEVYAKEKVLRDDVKSGLKKRSLYRRTRRTRKTRYRKPRFDNRTKATCNRCRTNNVPRQWKFGERKGGGQTKKRVQTGRARLCRPCARKKGEGQRDIWLAPSVAHRKDTLIREIKNLSHTLPISRIRVELTAFDSQKMQNPDIQGIEYQNSPLNEGKELEKYKRKAQVRARDKNKCVYCGEVGHQVDHVQGGSSPDRTDRIENLVWSCRDCNQDKNASSLETWERRLQRGGRRETREIRKGIKQVKKGEKGRRKSFRHSALTHTYKNALMKELIELYPGIPVQETFGYFTEYYREKLGMKKSHLVDAGVVATKGEAFKLSDDYIVERQIKQRYPHDYIPPDKEGQPIVKRKREYKKEGFRLWDHVKFNHKREGEIRGYVTARNQKNLEVRTLRGHKIKGKRFSKVYKDVTLLKPALSNYVREKRKRKKEPLILQLTDPQIALPETEGPSSLPSGQLLLFD